MKKITFLLTALFTSLGFGQTPFFEYSFEDNGQGVYTTSVAEFSDDGGYDFFTSTFNNTIGTNYGATGQDGDHYFAAQDLDGEGGPSEVTLSMDIDISGKNNLGIKILVAEDDYQDPKWDEGDYVHIDYSIDSGNTQNLFWFEAEPGNATNTETRLDTDFDGLGDGIAIPEQFLDLQSTISGTGNILTLTISFKLDSGGEDLSLDHIRVYDDFTPEATINVSETEINGLDYIEGQGASDSKTFSVSGENLLDNILVAPSIQDSSFEIAVDDNSFGSQISISPDSGTVSSTMIYIRLKAGLQEGNYSETWTVISQGLNEILITVSGNVYAQPTQDLFISEYAEGSSNNKYIEIFNPLQDAVDLSTYTLKGASNGGGEWNSEVILSGNLASGETFIIVNDAADPSLLALQQNTDFHLGYPSPVHYNGNDAVGLFKGTGLIDVIGDPNNSANFDVASTSQAAKDHTLVRKQAITQGNILWPESAGTDDSDSEWVVLTKDTWKFAGSHPHTDEALTSKEVKASEFKIYPNPISNGRVTITSQFTEAITAAVFDILGKEVINERVNNNTLDVSQLNKGIYLLKLTQNGASVIQKLVIK